jgi:hypothetical protein
MGLYVPKCGHPCWSESPHVIRWSFWDQCSETNVESTDKGLARFANKKLCHDETPPFGLHVIDGVLLFCC